MKKAGMKKGKNKEFSTPYTVTNAVAKGNIITKLSLLIMVVDVSELMGSELHLHLDRKGTDVPGC